MSTPKRILWLINHKTLMQFEVPLLIKLGYEVFVPKVIPSQGFRSGVVDFSFDRFLTLGPGVLKQLNEFNFYEDTWTSEIEKLINSNFNIAFVRPFTITKLNECLSRFEGHVALRGFGNNNFECYARSIAQQGGIQSLNLIKKKGKNFSFAIGYEELAPVEPTLLANRAVYLPIGLPNKFYEQKNSWRGSDRRILVIMPDIMASQTAIANYKEFKSQLGHFPHVIVGNQSAPVDDPNVVGFVTDDELRRLFQTCSAYFYPSRNLRHVLYSPIEAAVIGQPVIFYEGTLLSRLCGRQICGSVSSPAEAAQLIERILQGDSMLISQIVEEQQVISEVFSERRCQPIVASALEGMLCSRSEPDHGIQTELQSEELVTKLPEETAHSDSMHEWIDFSSKLLPSFLQGYFGLSWTDEWGRWSEGERILLAFDRPLPRRLRLIVKGGAYEANCGLPIKVSVGNASAELSFETPPWSARISHVDLDLTRDEKLIELRVPQPTQLPNGRCIGIGLSGLRIIDLATASQFDVADVGSDA